MKKTIELTEIEAAGLEALVRANNEAAQRADVAKTRLESALYAFGQRAGAAAVHGYAFNPPSITLELPDAPPPAPDALAAPAAPDSTPPSPPAQ